MTNEEVISSYKKIIDDQSAIIKGYVELVDNYERQLKLPKPNFTQGLLGTAEILVEHLKKNAGEPLELDSLKISDEERRKRFGIRVKNMRKSLGLTQEELAEKIGMSKQAVTLYETGRREAGYKNLVALSRALNVTTDWLLGAPPPITQ